LTFIACGTVLEEEGPYLSFQQEMIFKKQKVKLIHNFIGLGFRHGYISMLQRLFTENWGLVLINQ
jgi:hypothetical protein